MKILPPKQIAALTITLIALAVAVALHFGVRSNVTFAKATRGRDVSPKVDQAARTALSAGNNAFAFELHRHMRSQQGNLFYSPYSISTVLTMVYAGARNNTERQMASALRYSLPQDQVHPAFNALALNLNRQSAEQDDGFRLNIANSIWGQADYKFRPQFLELLAENYGAGVGLLDFKDESKREQSRQKVNHWVSKQTEDKIKDLVEAGMFTKDTRLVLTNAVYFKAEWGEPFLRGTENRRFTLPSGDQITVPMMSRKGSARYAKNEDCQAIEIAYKGDRFSLVALLPSPNQFEKFESLLNAERIKTILQSLQATEVWVGMPKFKFESSLHLADKLAELGMPDAFNAQAADFSGMDGTRDLFLARVIHKAKIAVDELGTEAAAATGGQIEYTSGSAVLDLDRPFIFFIRDAKTDTILFIGRVVDPR